MSVSSPPPLAELAGWVESSGRELAEITPLAGDVSLRRYYRGRLRDGGSIVLAWYPAQMATAFAAFVTTTGVLQHIGVRVPAVLECSPDADLMLLEDCGDAALVDLAAGSPLVARLYRRALDFAARIAALSADLLPSSNAPLDEGWLRRELEQTWRVFLEHELADDTGLRRELARALETVCTALASRPLRPCHRDLMARNLLVRPAPGPGAPCDLIVIDHQDLRLGPPLYDVASLLHDSTRLLPEQIERLEEALLGPEDREHYARACVQRLFKIVGTFHAFAARGDTRHLPRVAPALHAAVRQLAALPEGAALAPALASRWRAG